MNCDEETIRLIGQIPNHLENLKLNNIEELTIDEIKKSYRQLAKKYHPDIGIYKDGTMMIKINDSKDFLIENLDVVNSFLRGEFNFNNYDDEPNLYQEEFYNRSNDCTNESNFEEDFNDNEDVLKKSFSFKINNVKLKIFMFAYIILFVSVAFIFSWYGSRILKMDWMNWPKILFEVANVKWAYSDLVEVDYILLIIQWVLQLVWIIITWVIWGIVWVILIVLCAIFYIIMYALLPIIPYFILFGLGVGIYEIIANKFDLSTQNQRICDILLLILIGLAYICMLFFCMI